MAAPTTRLDRLVLLLDTGSTPSVRLTAARQLADLAGLRVAHGSAPSHHFAAVAAGEVKQEPGATGGDLGIWRGVEGEWNEVFSLVARILPHLESRSFETRQAAAAALSHISRAVGIWDPTSCSAPTSDTSQLIPLTSTSSSSSTSDFLSLAEFDLNQIMREGSLLLSSSGKEYAKLSSLTKEELAKAQKAALGKLGLGGGVGGGGEDELGLDMESELAAAAGGVKVEDGEEVKPKTTEGSSRLSSLPPPKFAPGGGSIKIETKSPSATPPPPPPHPPAATEFVPPPPPPAAILESTTTPSSAEPEELNATSAGGGGEDDPYAGLSARERNKLKRKRKTELKAPSGGSSSLSSAPLPPPAKVRVIEASSSTPSTPPAPGVAGNSTAVETKAVPAGEMVVIDPGAKARAREKEKGGEVSVEGGGGGRERAEMEVREGEWPWRGTVERLGVALLSPNWETRHGAALGLKEVLKLQGGGGGKIAGYSIAQNAEGHRQWCEDLAAKLLCVFALDRFGDYISDQVIAPVRETAAQALATLLPFMPSTSVLEVQRILIAMIDQNGAPPSLGLDAKTASSDSSAGAAVMQQDRTKYAWQVRHSGLLGLKYLVAVRGDVLRQSREGVKEQVKMEVMDDVKPHVIKEEVSEHGLNGHDESSLIHLKAVVEASLLGLRDRDDDVRSAAAATLTPITDALVHRLPTELQTIVTILWDCLGDLKDDLSSSIGGVMDLLANLLAFPEVLELISSPALGYSLADLVPRLFPFFRHTITSVRLAVLNTTLVFLELPKIDHSWADERLLRLLFQNLVVEEKVEIKNVTAKAWTTCLSFAVNDPDRLVRDALPHLDKWFTILTTPIGTPTDPTLFWSATVSLSGRGGYIHNVDKAILNQDLALVSVETIMRGRIAGAAALGALVDTWPLATHDMTFGEILTGGLESTSALHRYLIATTIEEWAAAAHHRGAQPLTATSTLASRLSSILATALSKDPPTSYSETTSILDRIQIDCQTLYAMFGKQGKVPAVKLPVVPAVFGLEQARQVVAAYDSLVPLMGKSAKKDVLSLLEEQQRKISAAIGYYEVTKTKHDRQVYAAIGGAIIALRAIPAKLTPLIRSITSSIKTEDILQLQARSAHAIAAFIDVCSSPDSKLKANPSDKLIKNLCTFLCQDVSRTPIFAATKSSSKGILTLEYKPARGVATKESKDAVESEDSLVAKLVFRGAQLALGELASRFGSNLLQRVPKLWSCMSDALLKTFASGDVATADALMSSDDQIGQDLLDCLTVLPACAQKVGPTLHSRLEQLFPSLALAARSKFSVIRYAVAKCFAALCDSVPLEGLRNVVEAVIPVVGDPLNVNNRRGAIELISHIVDLLDVKILPYVIFLVVPVLGRMSDPDDDVRLVATNTFATLVKLVPLEAGLPDPPGFSADLLAKRHAEREFLAQLLDGTKVAEYKIPIPISIELRKYQRDGVSWLAFLAKYQLHGLLCDDMGLGKTLQSICILASKHHERSERYAATNSPDAVHLPSLVVCPPTLTGHWQHEIKTYAPHLRSLIYTGAKAERERLAAAIPNFDVVIVSYDILRNDIDSVGEHDFHYCILDEGHVIKNGKTKLTKAVKTIRAIHRLILSGTPIQNNVLEMWSLFDFLMPGFLGSEKAFNERFGKPIAASRDAKSSSKEQEAGALALEALHKQVLPFLLRRLKEDVLDDLPPKIIQDYYCELSPLQKQLYDDFSTSQAKQVVDGEVASAGAEASESGPPQHVFQALQYLRKLVNHPALVMKPDTIPKHAQILDTLAQDGSKLRDVAHAPKLLALKQILLDCGIGTPTSASASADVEAVSQHRVLIFCQLKQMLDIVENDLFKTLMPSVTYMRMDGATDVSKRHAVVQTFNADPSIDCLLLTTHVGGLGLNLTGADTVIFVEHDWNPMKDLQAMDRAHRLGQKKVVNVYRLIMRGTLEEKIMGLQRFKLNIASSVVTQQNSDLSTLGTDGVLDLFTVSSVDAAPVAETSNRPVGQKALLDGLEDLPPDDEYQDFSLASFTSSL